MNIYGSARYQSTVAGRRCNGQAHKRESKACIRAAAPSARDRAEPGCAWQPEALGLQSVK